MMMHTDVVKDSKIEKVEISNMLNFPPGSIAHIGHHFFAVAVALVHDEEKEQLCKGTFDLNSANSKQCRQRFLAKFGGPSPW